MTTLRMRLNDIIDNTPGSTVLPGPCRVLAFHPETSHIWLIAIPGQSTKKATRIQDYAKAPFEESAEAVQAWITNYQAFVHQVMGSPKLQFSEALLHAVGKQKHAARLKRDIAKRDFRHKVVMHLLQRGEGDSTPLSPNEVLISQHRLRQRIHESVELFSIARTSAYHFLHLYWAGGSQANALLPRYEYCGSPGVPKNQTCKLGRPPRAFIHGETYSKGYLLKEEDKTKLAWGYALVNGERTLRDAYLLASSTYWSTHDISQHGKTMVSLLPSNARPTFDQFIYWGKKLSQQSVKDMLLHPQKLRQIKDARGGSVQDQVSMVGQRGCFDGTSTDLHLCSLSSRLKKLPAMTRSIVKDIRSDLILGVYCGWEAPSPATALRTLLHGASDKVDFCARFNIQICSADWPAMLPRTILADNGELKGNTPTEAERQFGFGIEYAPVGRGDKKGSVETQHRTDHKKLDHKLPGSTQGRRRARGEDHPAIHALWNYYEYMGELIRHIMDHNTKEEVPHLAPTDMMLEEPPIKPTRLNIFNWLRDRGMALDVPVNIEAFRAFTLPDWPAVIRKNGLYLKAEILGRETHIPRLRYVGDKLIEMGLMAQVKKTGSPIHVTVKIDPEDLSTAWLPTQNGLFPLFNRARDTTFLKKMTLTEWLQILSAMALRKDADRDARDQYDMERVTRRQEITNSARAELRQEEIALGGRPSKQSLRANLRQHRDEEMLLLKAIQQKIPSDLKAVIKAENITSITNSHTSIDDPIAALMDDLNDEEMLNG